MMTINVLNLNDENNMLDLNSIYSATHIHFSTLVEYCQFNRDPVSSSYALKFLWPLSIHIFLAHIIFFSFSHPLSFSFT
jgi:hypothetical protein